MRDILPELNGKEYTEGIYEDYIIKFCDVEDLHDLIEYLRKYWREDHIFTKSKELFDHQHYDKANNRYNFVIARERDSKEIHAILGFVPTSQYDESIKRVMVWPCIWKNRDDIKRRGLGVTMYYYLKCNIKIETISILGISEIALSIYKHWNFKTGKIEQYVMPNRHAVEHLSTGLLKYLPTRMNEQDNMAMKEISEEEFLSLPDSSIAFKFISIYKSKLYYVNRFFRHPIYSYKMLGIYQAENLQAFMVVRECGDDIAKCLRIVDFVGEISSMKAIYNQINTYMDQNNYEYIDFVEVGLDDDAFVEAGFFNRRIHADVVVPNYFEPFVKKNVDLDYAFKTVVEDAPAVFYKADADQDRPNLL